MQEDYQSKEYKIEKRFQEIEKNLGVVQKNEENTFNLTSINELMSKKFKDVEWLAEQLIPAESTIAISGAPASFKTWIVLELALKISKGEILFNKFRTSKTNILIVDEENGERLLQKRFRILHNNFGDSIYLMSLNGFKISESNVKQLISAMQGKNIKLVIFDSLIRIHGSDENDAVKMANVFGLMKKFNIAGITVIFTHHNRKQGASRLNPSQDMRGSSDIMASIDCHLGIARDRKQASILIDQTKLRYGEELKPFRINITRKDGYMSLEYAGEIDETDKSKEECKEEIVALLYGAKEPLNKTGIVEALKNKFGQSMIKQLIEELIEGGTILTKSGAKNSILCFLGERTADF
jgi:hypothetical protein